MKALFLTPLLLTFFSVLLHAQPVGCHYWTAPYPVNISQPDGSQVLVVGHGTSAHYRQETTDGYTVVENQDGFLEYAIKVNGKLAPSGMRVSTASRTQSAASPAALGIPKHLEEDVIRTSTNPMRQAAQAIRGVTPSSGNVNMLVIMVEFSDFPHRYELADYQKIFKGPMNEADQLSFEEYYRKASYGQLNFNVDFAGWYTAKGSIYDYGHRNGYESARNMVVDAIQMADKDVDFSKYDNDNDGIVDGVIVLQAGYGAEEGSKIQYIWSHKWSVVDQMVDGKIFNEYCVVPGVRNTGIVDIGIIAHEVGHLLGQPDLYDTSNKTAGVGYWDMMATGSWAGGGHQPADFSAWTKDRWGWINIQDITGEYGDYDLSPSGEAAEHYYRINTPVEEEYFLLEYRDNKTWEQGIPGSGLAIWHVNENGQQYTGIPKEEAILDMEEANGEDGLDHGWRGSWNDVFGNDVHELDHGTWPNSDTYLEVDGSYHSGIGLANIQIDYDENNITFSYFPSSPGQGQDCSSALLVQEENTMTHDELYYTLEMPAQGKLIFYTDDSVADYTEVIVGTDCESISNDNYGFYYGYFTATDVARTETIDKGELLKIRISQPVAGERRPFTWKMRIEDPFVDNNDSLAVVAVFGALLDSGWEEAYEGKPMSDWGTVTVENHRVTSLSIYTSEDKKDQQIPDALYTLTALKYLTINNQNEDTFTKGISSNIKKLTALRSIDMSGVQSDELLSSLPSLTALEFIYISGGKIGGQIPEEISVLKKLVSLYISGAQMKTTLPEGLGELTNLEWMELSDNQVTGSIPASLGKLKNLGSLYLQNNQLKGAIPAELISGTRLAYLDISYNQLTQVPDNLLSSETLLSILLSNNQISNFPANVSEVSEVSYLNLSHNQIQGHIPKEIRNRTFEYINISYNGLNGHLPSLVFHGTADVSHNGFTSMDKMIVEEGYYDNILNVAYNQFSFDDLLINQDLYPCRECSGDDEQEPFWAERQDSVHVQQEIVVAPGDSLIVALHIDEGVENSTYYWFRDDQAVDTTKVSTMTLENFSSKMEGNYRCEIINSSFQDDADKSQVLKLYYDSIRVRSAGRLPQLITVEKVTNKTFGDAPFSITASSSVGIPLQYEWVAGSVQLQGKEVTIKGAGKASVRIFAPGNDVYNPADTTLSFTIAKATQLISFEQPEDVTIKTDSLSIDLESSSRLPVSLTVKEGQVTVIENIVLIEGTGNIVLEASQSGNDNYKAAEPVTISFKVLKESQEIIFPEITDKRYGDEDFTLTAYSSADLNLSLQALTDNITIKDNKVSIVGAGEARIQAMQPGNSDYKAAAVTRSFNIEKAEQFIAMDSLWDQNIQDKSFSFRATASSGLPVTVEATRGAEHVSIQDSVITFSSEGEVEITVSQLGNENYKPAVSVSQTFNIYNPAKQDQSILVSSEVPASPGRGSYYRYEVTTTSGLAPKVEVEGPGEWQEGQIIFTATGEVTVNIFQEGNEEYNAAPVFEQSFTVVGKQKKTQQITHTPLADLTYGDAPLPLGALASSGLPLTYEHTGPIEIRNDLLFITGAGEASLSVSQEGNDEYQPATLTLEFSIRKAAQTIMFEVVPVNDTTYQLVASASSGLPVSFTLLEGAARIDGEWLYTTQNGATMVEATQAGNENYESAQPVQRTQEVQIVLALEEAQQPDIHYYPNPVIHTVSLTRSNSVSAAQVYLFDPTGKQVLSRDWKTQKLQLDLSALPEGVYLLYYQQASGQSKSTRLIKK